MLMLDLCCGLGGASKAMKERGWDVITVDIDPEFNPTIVADLRTFHYSGPRPDLVWASPPCTEFSKYSMPESWACNQGGKKNQTSPCCWQQSGLSTRQTPDGG